MPTSRRQFCGALGAGLALANGNLFAEDPKPKPLRVIAYNIYALNGWIRKAELRAVNVGSGNQRPRFRVSRESLDEFLRSREVQPPVPIQRQRRRPEPPEGGPIDPVLGETLLKKGEVRKVGNKYYRVWNGMTLYV